MTHSILSFTNPGEIDPRAFTLLGLSAKDSTSAIGRFGTGLKYAIAITLRLGGSITIWSGLTRYDFSVKPSTFRGKPIEEIEIITPDSRFSAPFTATYGQDWEPWMSLRELESNARDEGGRSSRDKVPPAAGQTTIWVDCPAISEAYKTLDSIFLSPSTLLTQVPAGYADIHSNAPSREGRIYYRGVSVGLFTKPTLFTYNFHSGLALSEDRAMAYWTRDSLPRWICETIRRCTDPNIIEKFLTAPSHFIESTFRFVEGSRHDNIPIHKTFYATIRSFVNSGRASLLNPSALLNYYKTFELADALYETYTPTSREKELLVTAQTILALYFDGKVAPFTLATSLPDNALGLVYAGRIYISKACFGMGLETLLGTLFEEYCHFYLDHQDESRTFQNYLIDTIAKLTLELDYERNKKA